ncbi:hypothetical protein N7478_007041 [Penicillium angulare]|uniref:uncharacterized protein n=1 Tax=Penicillium angulare TaxID=116970 RepID=UPI0025426341|nr:uncharacterized protein N7478_007041 [Penicillium angulare]KAJ5281669.1 hypothetical protein N7478_007041 [Penicillium angulare]
MGPRRQSARLRGAPPTTQNSTPDPPMAHTHTAPSEASRTTKRSITPIDQSPDEDRPPASARNPEHDETPRNVDGWTNIEFTNLEFADIVYKVDEKRRLLVNSIQQLPTPEVDYILASSP